MKHRLPIFPAIILGIVGAVAAGLFLARAKKSEPASNATAKVPATRSTASGIAPTHAHANLVPAPKPDDLVEQAAKQLASHGTVTAKINLQSELFGESLTVVGQYLQGAPDSRRLRLDLKLKQGGQVCSLRQVSDGTAVWIQQNTLETSRLGRIDVARAAAGMHQSGHRAGIDVLALGGLAQVLDSLHRSFEFRSLRAEKLGVHSTYAVLGVWKPAALERLKPTDQPGAEAGPPLNVADLPEFMPNQMEVFIGRDDLFPYQIDYYRAVQPGTRNDSDQLLARMKLVDVHFDVPIDPAQFVFNPGERVPVDDTEAFLRRTLPR